MDIIKISSHFYVAAQITVSDVGIAAAQGIKTIINNRPDNESPDQPATRDIEQAAKDLGIDFLHIPVISGSITDENIDEFEAAYRAAIAPVLAYCRTGTRSTSLWALVEAKSLDVDAILNTASEAGYDLVAMRPRLESRS